MGARSRTGAEHGAQFAIVNVMGLQEINTYINTVLGQNPVGYLIDARAGFRPAQCGGCAGRSPGIADRCPNVACHQFAVGKRLDRVGTPRRCSLIDPRRVREVHQVICLKGFS